MIDRALALAARAPHLFTLQYPPSRAYFQERFRGAPRHAPPEEVLLYVHVPFCAHRCAYCNFAVDVSSDESRMEAYIAAVEKKLAALAFTRTGGIDLGGGTPTRLPPRLLARVLRAVRRFEGAVSIETTPEIAATSPETIAVLREYGVERVSVGLQSGDDDVLESVRRPTASLHARALEALGGFPRVNVDLVFALPGQSRATWQRDVAAAIALGPDSITTYDCLYRGKGRALTRRSLAIPTRETYGALYDDARALLVDAGYHAPYGSVNHSRHPNETGTSPYFERRLFDGWAYVGVGNYATSHAGDTWTFELAGVDAWTRAALAGQSTLGDTYVLPRDETMTKYLLLSLSFGRLDRARFARRFGEPIEQRFSSRLAHAVERGWLNEDAEGWGVVRFDALPSVRALLYTERALDWLEIRSRAAGASAASAV